MNYKKYLILSSSVLISLFSFEGLAALPNNPDRCASQCTETGCKKNARLAENCAIWCNGLAKYQAKFQACSKYVSPSQLAVLIPPVAPPLQANAEGLFKKKAKIQQLKTTIDRLQANIAQLRRGESGGGGPSDPVLEQKIENFIETVGHAGKIPLKNDDNTRSKIYQIMDEITEKRDVKAADKLYTFLLQAANSNDANRSDSAIAILGSVLPDEIKKAAQRSEDKGNQTLLDEYLQAGQAASDAEVAAIRNEISIRPITEIASAKILLLFTPQALSSLATSDISTIRSNIPNLTIIQRKVLLKKLEPLVGDIVKATQSEGAKGTVLQQIFKVVFESIKENALVKDFPAPSTYQARSQINVLNGSWLTKSASGIVPVEDRLVFAGQVVEEEKQRLATLGYANPGEVNSIIGERLLKPGSTSLEAAIVAFKNGKIPIIRDGTNSPPEQPPRFDQAQLDAQINRLTRFFLFTRPDAQKILGYMMEPGNIPKSMSLARQEVLKREETYKAAPGAEPLTPLDVIRRNANPAIPNQVGARNVLKYMLDHLDILTVAAAQTDMAGGPVLPLMPAALQALIIQPLPIGKVAGGPPSPPIGARAAVKNAFKANELAALQTGPRGRYSLDQARLILSIMMLKPDSTALQVVYALRVAAVANPVLYNSRQIFGLDAPGYPRPGT